MKDIKVGDKVKILWTNEKLKDVRDYSGKVDKDDICKVSSLHPQYPDKWIKVNDEGDSCWITKEAVELVPPLKWSKEHFHNTKVRVTPEQSEKFQKVLAEYGIGFCGLINKQGNYDKPFLFIEDNYLSYSGYEDYPGFGGYPEKEINVLDYIDSPPDYLWTLDLIKASMEGKKVLYGGEKSEIIPALVELLEQRFANSKKEDYTVVDSAEIRSKIDALQQQIKELEAQL